MHRRPSHRRSHDDSPRRRRIDRARLCKCTGRDRNRERNATDQGRYESAERRLGGWAVRVRVRNSLRALEQQELGGDLGILTPVRDLASTRRA